MDFPNNITFRKALRSTSMTNISSDDNYNVYNNSTLDGTTNSLASLSDDGNDIQIKKLRSEIENLKTELNAAHCEVNNLSLENMELKKTIKDINAKYEILKNATKKLTSERCTPNKKVKSSTPLKNKHEMSKITQENNITTPKIIQNNKPLSKSTPINNKINKTQIRKLCIISSNKYNNILSIAQDKFDMFQICHYLTPYCGIEKLTEGIQTKLINYTTEDYCIIHIGEEDFRSTNNYCDIIMQLRQNLKAVQHTNVILCLPTFKFTHYTMMFNCRIEMFNNMLYLDNLTHNYAVLLDSNMNLTYDSSMFLKSTGRLNNNGLKNIYHQLRTLVNKFPNKRHNRVWEGNVETITNTNKETANSDLFRT